MALVSPRFIHKGRLVRAANGATIREGSRGSHIHLVQMALIDLGYPMPRSTGGRRYSPDGAFGNETKEKLLSFQESNNIATSGVIDEDTMLALDHQCRAYTSRVTLHFRSISLTNVPFARSLANAEKVYAQYGINIRFGSGKSLMLSASEEQTFNQIDGECDWAINTGEYNRLHRLGGSVSSTDILVYFVRAFADADTLGCGGHATNRPACTVASNASHWDTAHEVGHVLLTSSFSPVHMNNHRRNLMYPWSSNDPRIKVLTDSQINRIRLSNCCASI
ncbi:MAG: peptidoglycan-binding domain-containing protein [Xanthomonadales bacterium]|nr:peptidoglycan-binding domain-containing protein [Xanthomonadales bacterium]